MTKSVILIETYIDNMRHQEAYSSVRRALRATNLNDDKIYYAVGRRFRKGRPFEYGNLIFKRLTLNPKPNTK